MEGYRCHSSGEIHHGLNGFRCMALSTTVSVSIREGYRKHEKSNVARKE